MRLIYLTPFLGRVHAILRSHVQERHGFVAALNGNAFGSLPISEILIRPLPLTLEMTVTKEKYQENKQRNPFWREQIMRCTSKTHGKENDGYIDQSHIKLTST